MRVSTPAGKIPASRVKWLPMVLASAKRPYSDTIAAMPGNTASSAKKATPPEVEATLSAEIDQNTRHAISPHPRAVICSGVFASRPRPGSRDRMRSAEHRYLAGTAGSLPRLREIRRELTKLLAAQSSQRAVTLLSRALAVGGAPICTDPSP